MGRGAQRRGHTTLRGRKGADGLSGTRFPFSENRPGDEESGPGCVGGGRGQRPGLRQHRPRTKLRAWPSHQFYTWVTQGWQTRGVCWKCGAGPHHRVLRQVVVGPARNGVEVHQVLEVGYLALYPFLVGEGQARGESARLSSTLSSHRAPTSPAPHTPGLSPE